jgi:hypothetical protein
MTRKRQDHHQMSLQRFVYQKWHRYIQKKKQAKGLMARALTKLCWQRAFSQIQAKSTAVLREEIKQRVCIGMRRMMVRKLLESCMTRWRYQTFKQQ